MKPLDLTGNVFGRLTVVVRSEKTSTSGAIWKCVCACGNESHVASLKLRAGSTWSCGCGKHEMAGNRLRTHGKSNKSITYRTWKEMRQRCNNQNSDKWEWYGGRGITICERWDSYENFLEDMGERPEGKTIDRIDNNGNYEPSNCKWETQIDQTRKQEKNKLSLIAAANLRNDRASGLTISQLSEKYGISRTTAHRCAIGETWR